MQLIIPTIDEIRSAVRDEMQNFAATFQLQPTIELDEIGGIDLAIKITGKRKPTIYNLCAERLIPHSKQGKRLYFSRNELLQWLRDGKRKTRTEIALDAQNFPKNSNNLKTVAAR